MRIGIDVTAAISQGGGIGRYTRELIQALVAVDQSNGYHFFSARPAQVAQPFLPSRTQSGLRTSLPFGKLRAGSSTDAASATQDAGSPTLFVPESLPVAPNTRYHPAPLDERWLYRLWYRLHLPLPVQWFTGPLDLFHSPDFVLPPVSGRTPTLLTVHDLSFVHYPQTFPPALVAYLNRVVPRSIKRASHILADSLATKQDLVEMWQVPAGKITVLYSGVSQAFRPVTDDDRLKAMRLKYNLGQSPYLLSVGTIQPRKNYQMLIRAFRPVAARWPHNLVIVGGKGWLYDDILAEIGRQGLDGRVHFIGFVEDADLPALYTGATLFVFPSLYEGFGLPLLEAMACGLPVITSNASSLLEVAGELPDGRETAVALSPQQPAVWTEAINELIADPERRAQLAAAGLEQARRFTWGQAAQQLLGIYSTWR